jgi:hypothetical protein
MIGVIWNCRGVAKKGRGISIRELITDHKADFILLQEIMKKSIHTNFSEPLIPTDLMASIGYPQNGDLGGSYVVLRWKGLISLK